MDLNPDFEYPNDNKFAHRFWLEAIILVLVGAAIATTIVQWITQYLPWTF